VWIGKSGGSDVVLPAGTYVVRAEQGAVAREETVTVTAGSRKAVDLVLGTGRLDVTASLDEDGVPLDRVMFIVSEDDPDAPQGRREVTRSAAPSASFVLPAGTYYVTVRANGAETRQRAAVGAGDVVKRQIALGVSRLSVSTRLDKALHGAPPPLLTRVLPVEADRVEHGRSVTLDSEFLLGPGRYRIITQAGLQNVRAERIVEVKAKEHAKVVIPIEAAQVVLKLGDGAPATLDQFWEVKDAAGQVVWRTTHSEARMTLAPGRYTSHLEWRGRRIERIFDVKTGDAKTITFSAE
jgi:Ca-activated chloride channel family protein